MNHTEHRLSLMLSLTFLFLPLWPYIWPLQPLIDGSFNTRVFDLLVDFSCSFIHAAHNNPLFFPRVCCRPAGERRPSPRTLYRPLCSRSLVVGISWRCPVVIENVEFCRCQDVRLQIVWFSIFPVRCVKRPLLSSFKSEVMIQINPCAFIPHFLHVTCCSELSFLCVIVQDSWSLVSPYVDGVFV